MSMRPLRALRLAVTLAGLVALPVPLAAQCLQWDGGFGPPGGMNGPVRAMIEFDDGTGPALYAGGWFTTGEGVPLNHIAKRVGTSWTTLGSGLSVRVDAFAEFDDGTGNALYTTGLIPSAGGVTANHIARWDGASWSALGSGLSAEGHALAVFDDGSGPALYVGGEFQAAGLQTVSRVARWSGSSWSGLGPGGNSGIDAAVTSLAVFDDGSGPALYVGGYFTLASGQAAPRIARWDGSTWSSVGGGFDAPVHALRVFDDGSGAALYAGGSFTTAGGAPANHVARWDGSSWSALGAGVDRYVFTFGTASVGGAEALYAAGDKSTPGAPLAQVSRWDGSSWSAVGPTFDAEIVSLYEFDEGSGSALFAGGYFQHAGTTPVGRIARWDGVEWSATGVLTGQGFAPNYFLGTHASLLALATHTEPAGPALFAAGTFTEAGGVTTGPVARFRDGLWSPLASGPSSWTTVRALASFDEGSGPMLFAGSTTPGLRRWNGTSWSTFTPGISGSVTALAVFDAGGGPALYVGGGFAAAGGVTTQNLARWDGSAWSGVAGGVDAGVTALVAHADRSGPALYVAGFFTSAGGVAANRIARWNGTSFSPLGTGLGNTPQALASFDDGSGPALYAGGLFTTAGGVAASGVARWDGAAWSPLGAGLSPASVWALGVFDDGSGPALYAAGDFTSSGATSTRHIARWDGTSWSGLGLGIPGNVRALGVFDDGSDGAADLYAGGSFDEAALIPSWSIARWNGCDGAVEGFCFGDGSVSRCPCDNQGISGRGCDNSLEAGGARLSASGSPVPDTLVLHATGEPATALSIFLQGDGISYNAVSFGDGLRCAAGHLLRLYSRNASGGTVTVPDTGDPSISQRSASLGDVLAAGSVRHYQTYYRDPNAVYCPAPAGSTWNVTNGQRVVW